MKNPILVIDANYIGYRALFTTGPLEYKGRPTGVIYGVFSQTFTLLEKFRPSNIVFCWDSRNSLRRKRMPTYKSGRHGKDGPAKELLDAFNQFNLLREEILPRIGIVNNFYADGYEADDIIARIVMDYPENCVICSSDDDLLQLLGFAPIFNLGRKELVTEKEFRKKWGLSPAQWADVKTLAGCSGDSVPGLPGIGEKTAAAFLTGTLKENSKKWQIIKNASEEFLQLNRWLVSLPLPGTPSFSIKPNQFSQFEFERVCKSFGFHKLKGKEEWAMYL